MSFFAHFANSFVGTVYIWRYIIGHDISAPCLSHASEQFIKKHSTIFLPSPASLLCKDEIGSLWTVLRGPKLSVLWWLKTWSICRWAWSSTSTWTSATKQTTRERNIEENPKVLNTGRVFDDSISQLQIESQTKFERNLLVQFWFLAYNDLVFWTCRVNLTLFTPSVLAISQH